VKRVALARLLRAARQLTRHDDFVVIGSLSILGAHRAPPAEMIGSVDVDLYPRRDPGRIDEIARHLGAGSDFHHRHGMFADPVSPDLASLPDGWEARLVPLPLGAKLVAWCLEPNDAAVSKYVRCAANDREWCRVGLAHGILSADLIRSRLRTTYNVEPGEIERARTALDEDAAAAKRANIRRAPEKRRTKRRKR
jgi:hypothetical protein